MCVCVCVCECVCVRVFNYVSLRIERFFRRCFPQSWTRSRTQSLMLLRAPWRSRRSQDRIVDMIDDCRLFSSLLLLPLSCRVLSSSGFS